MEISNNLEKSNIWVSNKSSKSHIKRKNKQTSKENLNKKSSYSRVDDYFIWESRKEFLKKLNSKNSIQFLTQLLAQKEDINLNNSSHIAHDAYTKSIIISDFIYGKIEVSNFFA